MIPAWGIFQVKTMLYKNLGDLSIICSGEKQYGSSSRNEQLLCGPAIPFLDRYPKHLEAETLANTCTAMFAALFTAVERWKQLKSRPTEEQIKTTFNGILLQP